MLGPHSLGMAMSNLHFLYLARPYPWNVGNVCFTFSLYVIALCMMYVYLYMLVCGWSCTLYDGLMAKRATLSSHECSFPCSVGVHSRQLLEVHIHAILYVWSTRWACLDQCHLNDIGFPFYVTHINMFDALRGSVSSQHEHVGMHHIHRHETLLVRHSILNAKLCQIFCCENKAPPLPYSHSESMVRIVFLCYDALKAKHCRIFTTKIIRNAIWVLL